MNPDRTELQDPEKIRRSRQLSSQPTQPPTKVPGYDPERFLGEGAYGEVWLAIERNTGRRVAIKFYTRRRGVDWSLLSREVEKLAFLSAQRYVVQLVDVGWDADPPYYIMEYVEDGSLEDVLERDGTLGVEVAERLFYEIAVALVHSHGKGVLHCDLKPANVLLDGDFRPRLCDFGQSRLSDEQTPSLGTMFYMAPEQADLQAVPDTRWDVYALGALLYCMLTGAPPHRTEENIRRIEDETTLEGRLQSYRSVIEKSPPAALHRGMPELDGHLADITSRCLETAPSKRFPNVQTLLSELDDRRRRRARRPLLVFGVLAPVVLLVVMALFASGAFSTAVNDSQHALNGRVLESHQFAARFVAEAVARQVADRWRVLAVEGERRHADGQSLASLVRAHGEAVGDALGQPEDRPSAEAIQAKIQRLLVDARERSADLSSTSWFVVDTRGIQLARSPPSKTIDQYWGYRDYFHGEGVDKKPPEGPVPPAEVPEPIKQPHLSIVFVSKATGNRMVAFAVPLVEERSGEVLGVIAMTVELGRFTEVLEGKNKGLVTALVDNKPDSTSDGTVGRKGSVLEHPYLASLQGKSNGEKASLAFYHEGGLPPGTHEHYTDPIGAAAPKYDGEWLAAVQPVVTPSGQPTGWSVVVQEKRANAMAPVLSLRDRLLWLALGAIAVFVAVVGGLWALVWLLLRGPGHWRLLTSLRRRVGLTSASSLTSGSIRSLKTPSRAREHTSAGRGP